jgi:hypothetical protein
MTTAPMEHSRKLDNNILYTLIVSLFLDDIDFSVDTLDPHSDNQSDPDSEEDGLLEFFDLFIDY